MAVNDFDMSSMMGDIIAEATRKGEELVKIEKINKVRRAKGLPPIPDDQAKKDAELARRRRDHVGSAVVDGEDAQKLFEMRKAQMVAKEAGIDWDAVGAETEAAPARPPAPAPDSSVERAIKEAEAVRRVEDMKHGRINHAGIWQGRGAVEGGDATAFPHNGPIPPGSDQVSAVRDDRPEESQGEAMARRRCKSVAELSDVLFDIRDDLYGRLRMSFDGLEGTLSDLQGRVAEIVTASAPAAPAPAGDAQGDEFRALLERRTPVTFDVGGTRMSFDAIAVFHASPCITVVSKAGSATIMPKPGARLRLSYDMDGRRYDDDPVTFLGTRFELPMFGLSFVGFIRDLEAGDQSAEDA